MSNNKKIASVRPSPMASVVTIIGGVVALVFGFSFLGSVPRDSGFGGFGQMFSIVWLLACLGIIVYGLVNLSTYSKKDKERIPLTAGDVVEMSSGEGPSESGDFESRLRKLESLRRDGLISEEEHKRKREEIFAEKW